MSFTVGQLAKLSGLSVRSLHHYDEIGLLCPSERSEAGYRLYSNEDLGRLNRIQALRWLDIPLSEVKGVLDEGGAAIPDVVNGKIAALTQQIDAATNLRTRLLTLQAQFVAGRVSGGDRLLSAVELYKQYENYFSADDMAKFKSLPEEDAQTWRRAYDDVVAALANNVTPDSDEAQEIAERWGAISYKLSGGDLSLVAKAKHAFESDASVRRSISVMSQTDPAVMQFVLAASHQAHLKTLAKYLGPDEIAKLLFSTASSVEWMRIVTALNVEYGNRSPLDSAKVQALVSEWSAHLDRFTSHERQTKQKLLDAVRRDSQLQKRWLISEALIDFILEAYELQAQSQ